MYSLKEQYKNMISVRTSRVCDRSERTRDVSGFDRYSDKSRAHRSLRTSVADIRINHFTGNNGNVKPNAAPETAACSHVNSGGALASRFPASFLVTMLIHAVA
ncbi:hypothetical protein EVAR_101068_1 [Eumeta japonica]|uniref:Uncharacterized protein n=1 Tax=Eumeta variegata TaxID=151549 RepID=A0A4C1SHX5_EUMVA|nr:hypothetical protein EVAR_101068_1 [Eumeta japonica]